MAADAFTGGSGSNREQITPIVLWHTADISEAKLKQENISGFFLA
jgi:hypothetical protein